MEVIMREQDGTHFAALVVERDGDGNVTRQFEQPGKDEAEALGRLQSLVQGSGLTDEEKGAAKEAINTQMQTEQVQMPEGSVPAMTATAEGSDQSLTGEDPGDAQNLADGGDGGDADVDHNGDGEPGTAGDALDAQGVAEMTRTADELAGTATANPMTPSRGRGGRRTGGA